MTTQRGSAIAISGFAALALLVTASRSGLIDSIRQYYRQETNILFLFLMFVGCYGLALMLLARLHWWLQWDDRLLVAFIIFLMIMGSLHWVLA